MHTFKFFCRAGVHKQTLWFFVVTCTGGLLPLVFGAAISRFFLEWQGWHVFWEHGEFYLYSAAFYTHSIYSLYFARKKDIPILNAMFWLSLLFLAFACLFYSAVATSLVTSLRGVLQPDAKMLLDTSVGLLLVSLFVYYFSNYVQNLKESISVEQEEHSEITEIANQLG